MPAYNAARTLEKTYSEISKKHVDQIILVDDVSQDQTVQIAKKLGLQVIEHSKNRGYGGNQKTCYDTALGEGADIIVMVHPDYQYDPSAIPDLIEPISQGQADVMLGSRMINKLDALRGGMPYYKFISNIFLTTCENIVFRQRLSEYHTGLRAYSRRFLESINYQQFSEDFVFDTEIISVAVQLGYQIGEVPIKTRYQVDYSSISFRASVRYGLLTLNVLRLFFLNRYLAKSNPLFLNK